MSTITYRVRVIISPEGAIAITGGIALGEKIIKNKESPERAIARTHVSITIKSLCTHYLQHEASTEDNR